MPITAVIASSSGTPAATSAPNATIRMISVIGRREELRALEVVVEAGAERLVGGGAAELLDPQVGVRLLRRRGGGERRVDALLGDVVVTGDAERDQRGVLVLGDLALVALVVGRPDVLDVRRSWRAARRRVSTPGSELRVAGL